MRFPEGLGRPVLIALLLPVAFLGRHDTFLVCLRPGVFSASPSQFHTLPNHTDFLQNLDASLCSLQSSISSKFYLVGNLLLRSMVEGSQDGLVGNGA